MGAFAWLLVIVFVMLPVGALAVGILEWLVA